MTYQIKVMTSKNILLRFDTSHNNLLSLYFISSSLKLTKFLLLLILCLATNSTGQVAYYQGSLYITQKDVALSCMEGHLNSKKRSREVK